MNNLNNNYPTLTNRTYGLELEFVGVSPRTVAETINNLDGIECYFEGYHHTTRPYWKIVTDASLDGTGGEIVSPILKGVEGAKQLEKILDALDNLDGITVNVQCGLHVHLDVNDLTVAQIQTVYERYADYESQIDMIMPRSRRGNNSRWCSSVTNTANRIKNVRGGSKHRLANAAGRYYKVNLQSLTRYGTMEFRQHSGTLNFDKIINWVSFLMAFVEKSTALSSVTKSPKTNRVYSTVRNAVENAGFNMEWSRGDSQWNVTNADGSYHTYMSNYQLNTLYSGSRESSIDKCLLVDMLRDKEILSDYEHGNFNKPVVEHNSETDNGWLDGCDSKVQSFYHERELELN